MRDELERREFLGGLASTLGLLTLGGLSLENRLAYAANNTGKEYKDRYFVTLFMYGGWDVLLSVDPRDPTVFTDSKKGLTLIEPGYQYVQLPAGVNPLVDTTLGPLGYYAGELTKHTDKVSIVRGISMETLAHDTAYRRLITGHAPQGTDYSASSFDVWMASLLGQDNILPNIAMRTSTVNLDQPAYATAMRASSTQSIYQALSRKSPFSPKQEAAIQALLNNHQTCPAIQKSSFDGKAASSQKTIAKLLAANLAEGFNLNANTADVKAIKQHYVGNGPWTGAMSQVAGVSQALKTGVARVVTCRLNVPGLDTHNTMLGNGPAQHQGFNAFSRLIDDLAKSKYKNTNESWLDRTTVILASEITRTPLINTGGGRDHWLMNAAVLAGGDVKPGQVIGASSNVGMYPQPIDLKTGKVDMANGENIKFEHIYHSLMKGMGVSGDPADYRSKPIDALLK